MRFPPARNVRRYARPFIGVPCACARRIAPNGELPSYRGAAVFGRDREAVGDAFQVSFTGVAAGTFAPAAGAVSAGARAASTVGVAASNAARPSSVAEPA